MTLFKKCLRDRLNYTAILIIFTNYFFISWNKSLICSSNKKSRKRRRALSGSEMTTLVLLQSSEFREFKKYYLYISTYGKSLFQKLVSYSSFIQLVPRVLIPMTSYLQSKMSNCTGISFLDSISLEVCHIEREHSNKVFNGIAEKGKTSTGWFYRLKVHTIINHKGEVSVKITPGNVDDRVPVPDLCKNLSGKLFADKGYISKKLTDSLMANGISLLTKIKKNKKPQLIHLFDKVTLKKRAVIKSVFDQWKNIIQIPHTRDRSIINAFINILSAITAYQSKNKKPAIKIYS